jgi:hypothetical protein
VHIPYILSTTGRPKEEEESRGEEDVKTEVQLSSIVSTLLQDYVPLIDEYYYCELSNFPDPYQRLCARLCIYHTSFRRRGDRKRKKKAGGRRT